MNYDEYTARQTFKWKLWNVISRTFIFHHFSYCYS